MTQTEPCNILCLVATPMERDLLFPPSLQFVACGKNMKRYEIIPGISAVVATTGIGMVNAAIAAERLMPHASSFHAVINMGIAGISDASICEPGEWAVISEEWFGDMGVRMPDGFLPLEDMGFPLFENQEKPWNRIPVSEKVSQRIASQFGKQLIPGMTVNSVTGCEKRLAELKKLTSVFAENMEGASIAQICFQNAVPFVEIRGISNCVGDRDRKNWKIRESLQSIASDLPGILKAIAETSTGGNA